MRFVTTVLALGVLSGGNSSAETVNARPDLGSGPIIAQMSPCRIAYWANTGGCPEPAVVDSTDLETRMANRLARVRFFAEVQEYDKARAEMDIALGIDPSDVQALHLSARLWLTAGDWVRAERDAKLARQNAPSDPDIRATYAATLEWIPASRPTWLREYHEIIQQYPHHRFARQQRARMMTEAGRPDMALVDLNVLIADDPSDAIAIAQRAGVLLELGQANRAADDYSVILALQPGDFGLLVKRAEAYTAAGLYDLALGDYNTLLGNDPTKLVYALAGDSLGKLLIQRAFIYVQLHRFELAADDMIRAVGQGGKSSILRAQIFLRANGFPNVTLDGKDSASLRRALSACFGLNACFQGIMQAI
jgi:tetratricopeptide (TPR) repeat protein